MCRAYPLVGPMVRVVWIPLLVLVLLARVCVGYHRNNYKVVYLPSHRSVFKWAGVPVLKRLSGRLMPPGTRRHGKRKAWVQNSSKASLLNNHHHQNEHNQPNFNSYHVIILLSRRHPDRTSITMTHNSIEEPDTHNFKTAEATTLFFIIIYTSVFRYRNLKKKNDPVVLLLLLTTTKTPT